MTIIDKKNGPKGVTIYTVRKDLTDEETEAMNGKYCTNRTFKDIIDHDADVYTEEGALLMRFRKKVLPQHNVQQFYDNIHDFAKNVTAARGACSGSDFKDISVNKKIKSNIYGYFDKWTIFQKHMFKVLRIKPPSLVRVTRFTTEYPEKWTAALPLVRNIDALYKKLAPSHYRFQRKCAEETAFRIPGTAFTTFTTNVSTQMGCHRDSGNLAESFGNLVVIEKGNYTGGYLGYPQYRVGVDVRTGDFLACDIHQIHGNTPIRMKSPDAERLSIVCYLRQGVWENSKGTSPEDVTKNIAKMKEIVAKYNIKRQKIDKKTTKLPSHSSAPKSKPK